MASKSTWTYEQNKRFEDALAILADNKDVPMATKTSRWETIARAVGEGKSVEDVRRHYKALEEDIRLIDSGGVPLPKYYNKLGNKNGGSTNKGKSSIREEERTSQLRLR